MGCYHRVIQSDDRDVCHRFAHRKAERILEQWRWSIGHPYIGVFGYSLIATWNYNAQSVPNILLVVGWVAIFFFVARSIVHVFVYVYAMFRVISQALAVYFIATYNEWEMNSRNKRNTPRPPPYKTIMVFRSDYTLCMLSWPCLGVMLRHSLFVCVSVLVEYDRTLDHGRNGDGDWY